jgi:hypothetical protein
MSEQFVIIANIAGPDTQEGQTRGKDEGKATSTLNAPITARVVNMMTEYLAQPLTHPFNQLSDKFGH